MNFTLLRFVSVSKLVNYCLRTVQSSLASQEDWSFILSFDFSSLKASILEVKAKKASMSDPTLVCTCGEGFLGEQDGQVFQNRYADRYKRE